MRQRAGACFLQEKRASGCMFQDVFVSLPDNRIYYESKTFYSGFGRVRRPGDDGNATDRQAGELLEQAQTMFEHGEYKEALSTIDSLRKNCPEAIEARKKALKLYQEVELKRAELTVEGTDTVLQRVEREYQELKKTVDGLRAKSLATEDQLRKVNKLRVYRDSLKTVFDVECAKIKYIKKKMEE